MASNTTRLNLYKVNPSTDGDMTFNIQTMLNDNWDKIDSEVAKTTDIPSIPSSLPANGGNSTTVNNHTAAATPNTIEQTDLIGMINEAFTNANNGKISLANAIGLPTVASETFTQIVNDINSRKSDLTNNLSSKGVSASTSESLKSLIDKVSTIVTGKKFATGTVNASSFQVTASTNFTPELIFLWTPSDLSHLMIYSSVFSADKNYHFIGLTSTLELSRYDVTQGGGYVNSSGFKLTVNYNWSGYSYLAYGS